MYWPIGAPRVYAASNTKASRNRVLESDDDAESRSTTEGSGMYPDAASNGSYFKGEEQEEAPSEMSSPVTPITPGIQPVEHDTNRRFPVRSNGTDYPVSGSAEREPLLALRVSRTGHLFAVITVTSLTIWQTKVRATEI